jgi:modulator of FtsH protease HflK
MADPLNPNQGLSPEEFDPESIEQPYAEEAPEVEEEQQPRRAASARYIVDSEVGSEALLRDAMDPANQSLAEALRLSFRVLQAVIVVLILLFLASGFKTIDDGYSGVRTVWGRIVDALSPGPKFSAYPYPAGEFVTFKAENRSIDLGEYFTVRSRGRTREMILEQSDVGTVLNPGIDGTLITRDGDLAHLELSAKYEIDQPLDFVHAINDAEARRDADVMVKTALQRAAVHVVGRLSLHEFTDPGRAAEIEENLRLAAQTTLDEIKSGVRLVDIVPQPAAPYAIQKAMGAVQEAQVAAAGTTENARKEADQKLQSMAGAGYQQVLDLIDAYETALDANDEAESARILLAVNAKLESTDITGEVSQIINRARAYKSQIEATLGNEYQRFAALLPAYRRNPKLVIRQQWLEAYNEVVSRTDTEIVYVPSMLSSINLALTGSAEVRDLRQDMKLKAKEEEANRRNYSGPYIARGDEMAINEAGRQFRPTEGGKLVPRGTGE